MAYTHAGYDSQIRVFSKNYEVLGDRVFVWKDPLNDFQREKSYAK